MFKKSLDYGQAGDNIGALLRGVKRDDVQRGQVLAQPNTVKTYKKFEVRRKIKFSTRHLVSASRHSPSEQTDSVPNMHSPFHFIHALLR